MYFDRTIKPSHVSHNLLFSGSWREDISWVFAGVAVIRKFCSQQSVVIFSSEENIYVIIGARLAGASVSRTANLVRVSRTTVSSVMAAYTNLEKVYFAKPNCGRKSKLTELDRQVLKRRVARKHKTTLPQITFEINTHFQNHISTKIIPQELHAATICDRMAIPKPLVSPRNAMKWRRCCRVYQNWTEQQWEQVIWSDLSPIRLFQITQRVFVRRTFHVDCLLPTFKLGNGCVIVCFAIS